MGFNFGKGLTLAVTSAAALVVSAPRADAGGYAVREQSASLLGSAFAGAAAGVDLSSAFWNPAAFGIAKNGLTTENHYSVITADTELSNGVTVPNIGGATSTDIDKVGLLAASYGAYRINDQLVLGVSTGAPFGLATEPDDKNWIGRVHGRAAEMLTFNVSPTLAYEIAPGVHIAAGLQLQYMQLKLFTANSPAPAAESFKVSLDDTVGVGYTAGILLQPTSSTSVGLGFRSKIEQELEGKAYSNGDLFSRNVKADLDTPEIVTLSLMQAITPQMRGLATIEWTNWSRLGEVDVSGFLPNAGVRANWDDGWFYSVGLEYDYSEQVTLRTGVAYEKSPIQEAEQRLLPLPDSDRVWLSLGATYRYSEATTFDLGYSHIFFEDAELNRGTLTDETFRLRADVENSANIFSVGMKTKW